MCGTNDSGTTIPCVPDREFSRPFESCRESSPGRACRDSVGRDGSTGGRIGCFGPKLRSVLGAHHKRRGRDLANELRGRVVTSGRSGSFTGSRQPIVGHSTELQAYHSSCRSVTRRREVVSESRAMSRVGRDEALGEAERLWGFLGRTLGGPLSHPESTIAGDRSAIGTEVTLAACRG